MKNILRLCVNCPKLAVLAVTFHDLGKLNPNFKLKIEKKETSGYSNHSYLSALLFYYFARNNEKLLCQELEIKGKTDFIIKINLIIALIISHHQNLENLSDLIHSKELEKAWDFIESYGFPDASCFLSKCCKYEHISFQLPQTRPDLNTFKYFKFNPQISQVSWQTNALEYFMEAQYAFSLLVHADKTDAGNYEFNTFKHRLTTFKHQLNAVLTTLFQEHERSRESSLLNDARTQIREETVAAIRARLQQESPVGEGRRVFTVTAPTGAGKTFTLLALASEIMAQKGELGIIYAVPFLSITDQVKQILEKQLELDILTVNSQTENKTIQQALQDYESNPSPENLKQVLQYDFAEQTFEAPFVLTTFVQLFESLISNKNATLLKLANFSNRIFLLDEFQALPPRLYIFFTAWIEAFCRQHNCYAILSTATMPKLDFPENAQTKNKEMSPVSLFKAYIPPLELLNTDQYFSRSVFNRYKIKILGSEGIELSELYEHLMRHEQSVLVILNTINDTLSLYNLFQEYSPDTQVILLNTRFIPEDRKKKIKETKESLQRGERIILISTQLIEAGVDLDFPIVYRDFCPIANLVQSAGRCNRNNQLDFGEVFFFKLKNAEGKCSYECIYGRESANFLKLCDEHIYDGMEEQQLFDIQHKFYNKIKDELIIGNFRIKGQVYNMIQLINQAQFGILGEFKLIEEDLFGSEYRYYIPESDRDTTYEDLQQIKVELINTDSYQTRRTTLIKLNELLQHISGRIVNIRLNKKSMTAPPQVLNQTDIFGLYILANTEQYSPAKGLILDNSNNFL